MEERLTYHEMLTESRQIINRLEDKLKRREGDVFTSPALANFLKLQEGLGLDGETLDISGVRWKLRTLSEKELRSAYRDLKYIGSLKTSYAKSNKSWNERIKPILDEYDTWDKDKKRKFIEAYRKIMELGLSGEIFRYDVIEQAERAVQSDDVDEIPTMIAKIMLELNKLHADDDEESGGPTLAEFQSALQRFQ